MAYFVNTIEDFLKIKNQLKPVYIESKKYGKIEVPCVNTILVKIDIVIANTYNPNFVPKDKLELLMISIKANGFCFPIVTIYDDESGKFIIIDGFHRKLVSSIDWLDFDYIPIIILGHDMTKRMIATEQFNRARGTHQVDLDAELIRKLIEQGLNDEEIAINLGVDTETVYRYKQLTGIADIFKNINYSVSWDVKENE
jgi:ParB-like chromosome segregation protein Spo0J